MNTTDSQTDSNPLRSAVRFGACTLLFGVPALLLAATVLVSNRDKVRQVADRTADSIKQAGKSFTRAVEPRATHIDRAVNKINDAVRDALNEVRSALS